MTSLNDIERYYVTTYLKIQHSQPQLSALKMADLNGLEAPSRFWEILIMISLYYLMIKNLGSHGRVGFAVAELVSWASIRIQIIEEALYRSTTPHSKPIISVLTRIRHTGHTSPMVDSRAIDQHQGVIPVKQPCTNVSIAVDSLTCSGKIQHSQVISSDYTWDTADVSCISSSNYPTTSPKTTGCAIGFYKVESRTAAERPFRELGFEDPQELLEGHSSIAISWWSRSRSIFVPLLSEFNDTMYIIMIGYDNDMISIQW